MTSLQRIDCISLDDMMKIISKLCKAQNSSLDDDKIMREIWRSTFYKESLKRLKEDRLYNLDVNMVIEQQGDFTNHTADTYHLLLKTTVFIRNFLIDAAMSRLLTVAQVETMARKYFKELFMHTAFVNLFISAYLVKCYRIELTVSKKVAIQKILDEFMTGAIWRSNMDPTEILCLKKTVTDFLVTIPDSNSGSDIARSLRDFTEAENSFTFFLVMLKLTTETKPTARAVDYLLHLLQKHGLPGKVIDAEAQAMAQLEVPHMA